MAGPRLPRRDRRVAARWRVAGRAGGFRGAGPGRSRVGSRRGVGLGWRLRAQQVSAQPRAPLGRGRPQLPSKCIPAGSRPRGSALVPSRRLRGHASPSAWPSGAFWVVGGCACLSVCLSVPLSKFVRAQAVKPPMHFRLNDSSETRMVIMQSHGTQPGIKQVGTGSKKWKF